MRTASSAPTGSPVSRYCLARAGPSTSGQIATPPSPATMPTRTCGSHERRLGRHEDHVAEQRDRRAEPDRGTGQRRDDRQLDVEQVPDQLLRVAAQVLELREVVELGEPVEVAAGAEDARAPGQQHRARLVLALQLAEEPRELAVQQIVHRVALAGRMLDRDHEHVVARARCAARGSRCARGPPLTRAAPSRRPPRRSPLGRLRHAHQVDAAAARLDVAARGSPRSRRRRRTGCTSRSARRGCGTSTACVGPGARARARDRRPRRPRSASRGARRPVARPAARASSPMRRQRLRVARGRAPDAEPAVAVARGAAQRRVGAAADHDRDRRVGRGTDPGGVERRRTRRDA